MKAIGVVLIVLGIVGLAYGGISWTQKEKVVDLGPVEVTQNKTKSLPLPPIAGGICLVAGVILVVGTGRKS
jgi:uncharacterized membrane protein YidH (DUF202 family)